MTGAEPSPLEAAREIRHGVRAALADVESAAASSAFEAGWSSGVAKQLSLLDAAFRHHIDTTEAESGLLNETLELAPRLSRRVRQIRDEHVEIATAIASARRAAEAGDPPGEERATALRAAVTDLILRISRHRQIGADLVYEAYHVDIEGGD